MRCWSKLCISTLCLAVATCLLVGCNQPAVTMKPPAFQSSENTVRDWNDVARKIASGMASLTLVPTYGVPEPPGAPITPIFVYLQAPDSAFVRQVGQALESDILRRGGEIARTPRGATVVNLDVNFVRWGPRDKPAGLLGTMAGALAIPVIGVGDSLPLSTWAAGAAAGVGLLGVGALADTIIAITPTMNAEAVWEATIVSNDRVVMKLQDPIYIRADDIPLYARSVNLGPVSTWSHALPLGVRTIRYDP